MKIFFNKINYNLLFIFVNKKLYYRTRENFFTLSWTRIKEHNILAAGGSVQTINFITYEEGYCFHEEKFERSIIGVKVGITSIRFHPVITNILYCLYNLTLLCLECFFQVIKLI